MAKDDHGFDVPDVASAKAHVQADLHGKGDGHEHHDKAQPEADAGPAIAADEHAPHQQPKGRWVDDAWVGADEENEA